MADKVVVIFVEGATEIEFYKKLVSLLREKAGGHLSCKVITKNLKGIGNYKGDICRKMDREVRSKYQDAQLSVIICYDTDVFANEFARKPPIEPRQIKKELKGMGISNVSCIKANRSIEDWFLLDKQGLLSFLNLPEGTKIQGTGINELKRLFKLNNKSYVKGSKNFNFVNSLNIEIIAKQICSEICPLCTALGVDCSSKKACT